MTTAYKLATLTMLLRKKKPAPQPSMHRAFLAVTHDLIALRDAERLLGQACDALDDAINALLDIAERKS